MSVRRPNDQTSDRRGFLLIPSISARAAICASRAAHAVTADQQFEKWIALYCEASEAGELAATMKIVSDICKLRRK